MAIIGFGIAGHFGGLQMAALFRWFNNRKIWVRLVSGIWLILIILWSGMIYWAYAEQKDNAVEQARQELATAVANRTNELFAEYLNSEGDLGEALIEISNGDIKLLDVMNDEAELGRRIKTAMLKYLAREAERAAEREMT